MLKHRGQHQILLSYQGWLNQEIFHIRRVGKKKKGLKDWLEMQRGTQFGLSLVGNTEAPTECYRCRHPVARMWKITVILTPINLSENSTGGFKNVLCSPASGLLSGLEGPWHDVDAYSLPGLCSPLCVTRCVLKAGAPSDTPPDFHRMACKESRAETGSPKPGRCQWSR